MTVWLSCILCRDEVFKIQICCNMLNSETSAETNHIFYVICGPHQKHNTALCLRHNGATDYSSSGLAGLKRMRKIFVWKMGFNYPLTNRGQWEHSYACTHTHTHGQICFSEHFNPDKNWLVDKPIPLSEQRRGHADFF